MNEIPEEKVLLARLQSEFNYPLQGALVVAGELRELALEIAPSFWHWWKTQEIDETLYVQDFNAPRLMDEHNMTPIAAYLTLDWLAKEPQRAIESLQRGHDNIVTGLKD